MSNGSFNDDNNGTNGKDRELFREYRRLILSEIERLGRDQERFSARAEQRMNELEVTFVNKLDAMKSEIADLKSDFKASERERKVLSSVWGLVGGAVPIVMWMFYQLFQTGLG